MAPYGSGPFLSAPRVLRGRRPPQVPYFTSSRIVPSGGSSSPGTRLQQTCPSPFWQIRYSAAGPPVSSVLPTHRGVRESFVCSFRVGIALTTTHQTTHFLGVSRETYPSYEGATSTGRGGARHVTKSARPPVLDLHDSSLRGSLGVVSDGRPVCSGSRGPGYSGSTVEVLDGLVEKRKEVRLLTRHGGRDGESRGGERG